MSMNNVTDVTLRIRSHHNRVETGNLTLSLSRQEIDGDIKRLPIYISPRDRASVTVKVLEGGCHVIEECKVTETAEGKLEGSLTAADQDGYSQTIFDTSHPGYEGPCVLTAELRGEHPVARFTSQLTGTSVTVPLPRENPNDPDGPLLIDGRSRWVVGDGAAAEPTRVTA